MTMTQTAPEMNEPKFRELLLYISSRLADAKGNGSIMINKALFFSDAIHYKITGESITGVEYIHRQFGPAPRGLVNVQQAMIEADEAVLVVKTTELHTQKRLMPRREPDLTQFTALEISIVEKVLEILRPHSAEEISDVSHTMLAWKLSEEGETIPYPWVLMFDGPVPDETFEFAESLAAELRETDRVGATGNT